MRQPSEMRTCLRRRGQDSPACVGRVSRMPPQGVDAFVISGVPPKEIAASLIERLEGHGKWAAADRRARPFEALPDRDPRASADPAVETFRFYLGSRDIDNLELCPSARSQLVERHRSNEDRKNFLPSLVGEKKLRLTTTAKHPMVREKHQHASSVSPACFNSCCQWCPGQFPARSRSRNTSPHPCSLTSPNRDRCSIVPARMTDEEMPKPGAPQSTMPILSTTCALRTYVGANRMSLSAERGWMANGRPELEYCEIRGSARRMFAGRRPHRAARRT